MHKLGTESVRLGWITNFFSNIIFFFQITIKHQNIFKNKNHRFPFQKQTPKIMKLELLTQKIKEDEEEKAQSVTCSEIRGETTEG